jgi:hypothetical protein
VHEGRPLGRSSSAWLLSHGTRALVKSAGLAYHQGVRTTVAIVAVATVAASSGASASASASGTPIVGSNHIVAQEIPVTAFSRLQVSGPFDVRVSVGPVERVTMHVNDNIVNTLDVGVHGDALRIALKPGTSIRHATLRADVTVRAINSIDAKGAATIELLDQIKSDQLSLTLSGGSRLDGSVATPNGRVAIADVSRAGVTGSATSLDVTVTGASGFDAGDLAVGSLKIDLSGASRAVANITGSLSAGVKGASSLRYRGSPAITRRDVSGASSITPLG